MSVKALARRADLAPSTLYDLERGESYSTTKLHRIAAVLGCSTKWLETGKGSPSPTAEELLLAEPETVQRWPFQFDQARFERLTMAQRDHIERLVLLFITDCESQDGRPRRSKKAGARP